MAEQASNEAMQRVEDVGRHQTGGVMVLAVMESESSVRARATDIERTCPAALSKAQAAGEVRVSEVSM